LISISLFEPIQKKGVNPLIKTIPKKLSRDNSKLCFELLEMNSAAQNHLPLQGQLKTPKSFLIN
jgi:hypothetical protein